MNTADGRVFLLNVHEMIDYDGYTFLPKAHYMKFIFYRSIIISLK